MAVNDKSASKSEPSINTPDIYEQSFELNTTGLNDEEINRLRRKAYELSNERLQRVVSSISPTAWMKYLYYRIKSTLAAANGQPSSEEIGRRWTTVRGAVDEATGQGGQGDRLSEPVTTVSGSTVK